MSQKQHRLLQILAALAATTTPAHKHASALVCNGKILTMACNSTHHHAEETALRLFEGQYVKSEEARAEVHA
jgi:hypothetical protein